MPRRTTAPFLIVATALFVLLVASNMPTPLYAVYRERFGFSSAVLTLIFATYAVVLVPSLLLFGQLSDRLGRRRVIAAGLGVAMLGLALFAAARGTPWLFAARAVQGLSVGAITGAATAGLVELEPHGDRQRAALLSVLAQAGGCAVGPLIAGALAQWAPEPRVLCYVVALVVIATTAVAALSIPEPARASGRWEIQRPSVPSSIRTDFARASLTGAAVWAVAALFLSVVPSYAAKLLQTNDLALLGAIAATMLATSCATQWLASRRASARSQPLGLAVLACGLVALVLAFPLHSLPIVLAAALLAGAGHGLAFLGAQTEVNHLAPSDRRGEVTAAFMSCIYGGVAVSVIGVGVISTSAQSLYTAVAVFAAAIGVTAVLTAGWHLGAVARPAVSGAGGWGD
jgi:predicted MFS family arabinose efflux permease